jgi:hypothetical protein
MRASDSPQRHRDTRKSIHHRGHGGHGAIHVLECVESVADDIAGKLTTGKIDSPRRHRDTEKIELLGDHQQATFS